MYTKEIATHPQIKAGVIFLSDCCDGAHAIDGAGFNKLDNEFGHSLAYQCRTGELSYNQQVAAQKLLHKYRKQLKNAGIELPSQDALKAYLGGYESFNVESFTHCEWRVENALKGTVYEVSMLGEILQCSCSPISSSLGKVCKHIKAVEQILPPADEYEPEIEEVSSEPFQEPEHLQAIAIPTQEQLLPGITLNDGQTQALNEMLEFLNSDRPFHTLSGFAGTGKTTVLQALITKLRKEGDQRKVIFTAPTNKAVKVLAQMVDRWNLNVDAMTCHKLLGLKPHKQGKNIEFEPDPKEDPKFNRYELVVVDESSMLPKELYYHITNACTLGQKVLFIGDEYQAPPVNEARSLVFEKVTNVSLLNKIERYSGTNAVIVEKVRQTIDIGGKLPNFETVDEGDRGVFVLDRKAWEHTLLKYFQSEGYSQNPDYCRAIAYSNKRVEALNQKVRDRLIDSSDQWTIGERIIAQEAYSPGDTVVLQTSDEGEILAVDAGSIEQWDCLFLTVKLDIGETVCIPVVQREVKAKFEARLNELAEQKDWYRYWGLRETFADVRSPFAITGHKSQGSTYTNAFIDVANFNSTYAFICKGKPESFVVQKLKERNQLLYTAMGRASHKLFLCV